MQFTPEVGAFAILAQFYKNELIIYIFGNKKLIVFNIASGICLDFAGGKDQKSFSHLKYLRGQRNNVLPASYGLSGPILTPCSLVNG